MLYANRSRKEKKRRQREGSIYKRKDGRWAAAINLGYQDGKLQRKTFYGVTREEVKGKLVTALNDQQKGLPVITEHQALRWGLVARNVATLVESPRVERPEVQFMLPDDARKFLKAIEGDRLEALFSTALAMGLRQGEALGLRWEDVDFNARVLRVRDS